MTTWHDDQACRYRSDHFPNVINVGLRKLRHDVVTLKAKQLKFVLPRRNNDSVASMCDLIV
jgi:hypothetical protein